MLLASAATVPAGAAAGAAQPAAGAASTAPTTAQLLRNTQLRTRPDGPVVTTLGRSTDFGSPRVLAVVARRGDWLGVLSESMPAGAGRVDPGRERRARARPVRDRRRPL